MPTPNKPERPARPRRGRYQSVDDEGLDRKDHVWYHRPDGVYKCVLCGAVTEEEPPSHPTGSWLASRYEKLTHIERQWCQQQRQYYGH